MQIRIFHGKGSKTRYVPLAQNLLDLLDEYIHFHNPQDFFFEGQPKGTAISSNTLGVIFRRAVKHAGIQKKSTFYTESEGQEYLLACDKNYLLVLAEITGNLCKVFLRISFYQPWFYFQVTT